MERHMFFGANTPNGFFECFGDILFPDEAQRIIYLKGSSGSGKSTLMRSAAAAFSERGDDVDYIHCSNSAYDLDGICIRDYGIGIIDATAPHTCDPVLPGAQGEILNLADYLDFERATPHAAELLTLVDAKKPFYAKAYRYLAAARAVYDNSESVRSGTTDNAALREIIACEVEALGLRFAQKRGRNRRMFASAITPQGLICYLDTLATGCNVIQIRSETGTGGDKLLTAIQNTALEGGIDTECCYNPLDITKIEHLIIPALRVCYITRHELCAGIKNADRAIDLNALCDDRPHADELEFNKRIFTELLDIAMQTMAAQKAVHDRIEEIYGSCMDYEGVSACAERLIKRLTALPI